MKGIDMPDLDSQNAAAIYQKAHDDYLAEHPEPEVINFQCYTCKAEPGDPCVKPPRSQREFHLRRQDKRAQAFNARIAEAIKAGDAAEREYWKTVRAES